MSHIIEPRQAELEIKRKQHLDAIASIFDGWNNPKAHEGDEINYQWCWEYLSDQEHYMNDLAIIYCGDGSVNQAERSKAAEIRLDEMEKIISESISKWFNNPDLFQKYFFVNRDPRGYALKLKLPYELNIPYLQKDWGGYGILAPECFEK